MKKQTAVEWFLNEFRKQVWFEENSELDIWINDLIPKAKAMEKEQIIEFADEYVLECTHPYKGSLMSAEQYYNETYEQTPPKL